jgi:uncharacterized cysteine cluster protein YcgN (CxxCxxCC family)
MTAALRPRFWETVALPDMTTPEWEALCDGCGKCCMLKMEDEEPPHEIAYTNIACRLFDETTCRCTSYALRSTLVPTCIQLTPDSIGEAREWMPSTCAYRLLAEGAPLPEWHPLVTGDAESTHGSGNSMKDATVPEYDVAEDEWYDYVIEGGH